MVMIVGKHVLLVEPDYYTRFPPLGLLKLARYHKEIKKDDVDYVRGCVPKGKPDLIYITSLFTWAWQPVHEAVKYYKRLYPESEIRLGGPYATLLPEHAEQSGAKVYRGLVEEAEDLMPMYELIPKWNGSIIFSSRGCLRKCSFCAVPLLEGGMCRVKKSIKHLVYPSHTKIILWDNNFLGSPNWRTIMDELQTLDKKVDFNQGLDARLINEEAAERLSKLRMDAVRIAYDQKNMRNAVQKAIERLSDHGIKKRKILCYTLYNFADNSRELFERIRDLLNWSVVAYPMRYQPVLELPYALEKNTYVAPKWDKNQLETVASLRRVVGFAGTFPPYKALVDRFNETESFGEMLYPKKRLPRPTKGQLSLEMRPVPIKRIQRQKPKWNGDLDWMRNLNSS